MTYDLLITGGRVIDPAQGLDGPADVALLQGRVAAVEADLSGFEAVSRLDATGCLVVPGLIDLHTHVAFRLDAISIEADRHAPSSGVTTWVDAGSAGAANFAGFRHYVIEPSCVRILPFLNVSEPGLTCLEVVHGVIEHLDADSAFRAVEENRDLMKGIKVLSCAMRVGPTGLTPLRVALEVGRATDLPVMCHIGAPPPGLGDMLPLMRPGDIVTHIYKGRKGCLMVGNDRVRPEAWEARRRGVLFDVGHGAGSFSWEVARAALDQGFPPDFISSDLHRSSVGSGAFSLPSVMSKFLHLGLPLQEVVQLVTDAPARVLGLQGEVGCLRPGACGDVTVLRLEEGRFPLADCEGVQEELHQRLVAVRTVAAGVELDACS
ncbi:MAG: amidohydrolase/deacetylase family metallohydrolase [Anaerolineae bacterium]|nr:amidohydrolase/deacetylase family metallohydrolase [Anaerolineae bacterium]